MGEVYGIFDLVRLKYISQIIKIPKSDTYFMSIKFGDIYSAIVFDDYSFAQSMVDEINNSFSRDYSEYKMNLSVRRIHA